MTTPLFDQLVADIRRDDDTPEEALEREARSIVLDGRSEGLVPILPDLCALDLTDRPYTRILVAALANNEMPRQADLSFANLDAAAATLAQRGDAQGEAMTWWVRGNVHLGMGDMPEAARAWAQAAAVDPEADLVEELSLANLAYGSFCVDGDIPAAVVLAEAAITTSRTRGHGRGEALGLVYEAYLRSHAGEFERADRSFRRAVEIFQREAVPPVEWPLALAGMGTVAAMRGRVEEADEGFTAAIALAQESNNTWFESIVRTLRADHTLRYDARRAHADCRFAISVFDQRGDTWWGAQARRVRADAALAAGEIEAARLLTEKLLPRLDNPVERGRCLITAGKAHLRSGDDETAAAAAEEALAILEPTGASYILVQALFLLGQCQPWRAPEAIERARALSTDDPAYLQLWATRPTLRLLVLGRQSVQVGNVEVNFRTSRAEHLVMILALAGGRAVSVDAVCEALWPGARSDKLPSNLSTATYDARQGLGSEAWRLHRAGSQFWLDLDGAYVDLEDAMRRARGIRPLHEPEPTDKVEAERVRLLALDEMRREILPTLVFEPWVVEANQRRGSFLELLGVRGPSPARAVSTP